MASSDNSQSMTATRDRPVLCVAGKNSIAVAVLDKALEHLQVDEVVVLGNRTDDGNDGWQRSFRRHAADHGVRELELAEIEGVEGLVFLSVEFDRLIRPSRFATSRLYNVHFSALPAYKGMYTSSWPLLNGETESGVTLHEIDSGIDTGPIIDQIRFPIEAEDTARDLYHKYLVHGTALACRWLPALLETTVRGTPQRAHGASYYDRGSIDYGHVTINLRKTADEVRNQVRAFSFQEYQLPVIMGRRIVRAEICENRSVSGAGTVTNVSPSVLRVSTIDYDVLLHVAPE